MDNSKYYPLALEALVELAPEIAAARQQPRRVDPPPRPTVDDVIERLGSMPAGALFLGMADDGLPVLLNLHDPLPGPLLLVSDEKTGKTNLLKTVALASARSYNPEDVQFSIATHDVTEWQDLEALPHCAGILSIDTPDARDLVASVYEWTHQNDGSEQTVLLLIDGLDRTSEWDESTKSQLRWLLMHGPSRRIWPILTINSAIFSEIKEWLSHFKTFIYGKISNRTLADVLTGASRANLDALQAGVEFSMKEGDHWLRFWIPDPA